MAIEWNDKFKSVDALLSTNFFNGLRVTKIGKVEFNGTTYALGEVDTSGFSTEAGKFNHVFSSLTDLPGTTPISKFDSTNGYIGRSETVTGDVIEWAIHVSSSSRTFILKTLNLSGEQWDLASGEASYLGDTWSETKSNDLSIGFWKALGADETSNFDNSVESTYPSQYQVGPNGLTAPGRSDLIAIKAVAHNLAVATLGRNNSGDKLDLGNHTVSSGYAFDEGYYEDQKKFHAGIDIRGVSDEIVRSPIKGHVIQIHEPSVRADLNGYVVVRELDGDRIWLFGHSKKAEGLRVGDFVDIGDPIAKLHGNLKPIGSSHEHHPHLHILTAKINSDIDNSQAFNDVKPTHVLQDLGPTFSLLSPDSAKTYLASEFPELDMRFATSFDWGSVKGWKNGAFGQTNEFDKIVGNTDSPLQAYFEANPFSAVNTGHQWADLNSIFDKELRSIGGGSENTTLPLLITEPSNVDLALVSGYPNLNARDFASGDRVQIDAWVKNYGLDESAAFDIALYISDDKVFDFSEIVETRTTSRLLNPSPDSTFEIFTYDIPASFAGRYYLAIGLDPLNEVYETDETNNLNYRSINVSGPPKSDQKIVDASISDLVISAGDRPTISISITNEGTQDTGSTQLAFYRSTTPDFSFASFLGDRLIKLSAGETKVDALTVPASWTSDMLAGQTYYFFAEANYQKNGSESDFSDNSTGPIAVTVKSDPIVKPDYVISELTMSDTNIQLGAIPFIKYGSANLTHSPDNSVNVAIVHSIDQVLGNADDTLISNLSVPTNGIGTVYLPTTGFSIGLQYVFGIVDYGDSWSETDESNNVASVQFNIVSPPAVSPGLISVNSVTSQITEGNIGQKTPIHFDIDRTAGAFGSVTVTWAVTGGSNVVDTGGSRGGIVTFDDGDSTPQTITLYLDGDNTPEANEIIEVSVISVTGGGTISNGSGAAVVTVIDDDVSNGTFNGTEGSDLIDLKNSSSNQVVLAMSGNDTVETGAGNDTVLSGAGNDRVTSGSGKDTIVDPSGNDTISGGAANDYLISFSGINAISGNSGHDLLVGGIAQDSLDGGSGNDLLIADISDFAFGNDILRGGLGDDKLQGGRGSDIFVFSTNDGSDQIGNFNIDHDNPSASDPLGLDFVTGLDEIYLYGFGYSNGAEAFSNVTDVRGFAQFSDQGTTISFYGISRGDLSEADFNIF